MMSMTKQQRKIQDLLNQIESHEHKEELLKLMGEQVADDTYIVHKEM